MKHLSTILKVLAIILLIVAVIYIVVAYGDRIAEWMKNTVNRIKRRFSRRGDRRFDDLAVMGVDDDEFEN